MWKLFRNDEGASALEFALVIVPVMLFMIGIIQTGYVVWANNLLHAALDAAARCGAVNSSTSPCACPTTAPCPASDMISAANAVIAPLPLANATIVADTLTCNGAGLIGTYTVSIGYIIDLTLTAKSCYPSIPVLPPS